MDFFKSSLLIGILLLSTASCGGSSDGDSVDSGPTDGEVSATLTWTKPTENTNDSRLEDLLGFYVYFGTEDDYLDNVTGFKPYVRYVDNLASSSDMICENLENGGKMTCTVAGLYDDNNWYFSVTAVNSLNIESTRSQIVCKQFKSTGCLPT